MWSPFCLTFREGTKFQNSLESLAKEIINSLENEDAVMMTPSETPETDDDETPQIDITKKPGRAFLHKLTGKFLAESGMKSFRWMEQYEVASAISWRNFKTQEPRKRSFSKRLFKPGKLENTALRFHVHGKRSFLKTMRSRYHVISLTELSSTTNPEWLMMLAFSNSSGVVWTENIWCAFRVKPPYLNSFSAVYSGPGTTDTRLNFKD